MTQVVLDSGGRRKAGEKVSCSEDNSINPRPFFSLCDYTGHRHCDD